MWVEEEHYSINYQAWTQDMGPTLYFLIRSRDSPYMELSTVTRNRRGGLSYAFPHFKILIHTQSDWNLIWNDLPAFLMEELL